MFVLNLFYEDERDPELTKFITEKLQEAGIPIGRTRNSLLVTDHPIILAGFESTDVTEGLFAEHVTAMFNTQENINVYLRPGTNNKKKIQNFLAKHGIVIYPDFYPTSMRLSLLHFLTRQGIPCRSYTADKEGAEVLVQDVIQNLKRTLSTESSKKTS